MSQEREIILPAGHQDLEKLNHDLQEAIEDENFEKAAKLRDIINAIPGSEKVNQNKEKESKNSKETEKETQKSFWENKGLVDDSELAFLLNIPNTDPRWAGSSIKDYFVKFLADSDMEKVDQLIYLYNMRDDAKFMIGLSKAGLENIWVPYKQKAGLEGPEYDEYRSYYNDRHRTPKHINDLNKIPENLIDPLKYWQNIYDNARRINNKLETLINEMEVKVSK